MWNPIPWRFSRPFQLDKALRNLLGWQRRPCPGQDIALETSQGPFQQGWFCHSPTPDLFQSHLHIYPGNASAKQFIKINSGVITGVLLVHNTWQNNLTHTAVSNSVFKKQNPADRAQHTFRHFLLTRGTSFSLAPLTITASSCPSITSSLNASSQPRCATPSPTTRFQAWAPQQKGLGRLSRTLFLLAPGHVPLCAPILP